MNKWQKAQWAAKTVWNATHTTWNSQAEDMMLPVLALTLWHESEETLDALLSQLEEGR